MQILLGFIGDIFGPWPEPKSGEYFLIIISAYRWGENETSFAISPERLLQYSGEFAVSIRDVAVVTLGQGFYHVSQTGETQVYVFGLF